MEMTQNEPPRPIPAISLIEAPGSSYTLRKYDVHNENGSQIGEVSFLYYPKRREIEIGMVEIPDIESRNKGYGVAIYEGISHLSSPDGVNYKLVSSGQMSEDSLKVWESLVRRGLAVQEDSGRYIMLQTDSEPKAA